MQVHDIIFNDKMILKEEKWSVNLDAEDSVTGERRSQAGLIIDKIAGFILLTTRSSLYHFLPSGAPFMCCL